MSYNLFTYIITDVENKDNEELRNPPLPTKVSNMFTILQLLSRTEIFPTQLFILLNQKSLLLKNFS